MSKVTENSAYWLGRAKDVREEAQRVDDPAMKYILEEIASSYERIADQVKVTFWN
jgi:hypothetical protein